MGLEPKPFTQISKERMRNKIRCAGQVLSRCATSRASSNALRFFSLLGCRIIRIMKSHAHSESAALLPYGRLASYNKRRRYILVNKFPRCIAFFFIAWLVAYPKYRSNNPLMLCRDELRLYHLMNSVMDCIKVVFLSAFCKIKFTCSSTELTVNSPFQVIFCSSFHVWL